MSLYVCFCCGWPVIFRGPKPQVYHIPSGWHCWEMQKKDLYGPDKPAAVYIPSVTKKSERERLLEAAIQLYKEYLRTSNLSEITDFVRAQLSKGYTDVARDLIIYIAEERDERGNKLIERIIESIEWQEFVAGLQTKHLYREYMSTGDSSLALGFVHRQMNTQRPHRVTNMLSYIQNQKDLAGIVTQETQKVYERAASLCKELDSDTCFSAICELLRAQIESMKLGTGTYSLKGLNKKIVIARMKTILLEYITGYNPDEENALEFFEKLTEKWKKKNNNALYDRIEDKKESWEKKSDRDTLDEDRG